MPLLQANAYEMIDRRAGITAYLKNGGTLERAATMAHHAPTRTTQLYDRRSNDVSLDELERSLI
jgi:integrase/recombinase XerC